MDIKILMNSLKDALKACDVKRRTFFFRIIFIVEGEVIVYNLHNMLLYLRASHLPMLSNLIPFILELTLFTYS